MTNIIVYRDTLLSKSEPFIPESYVAFNELNPLYVGRKATDCIRQYDLNYKIIGDNFIEKIIYKHFGIFFNKFYSYKPKLIHAHFGRGGALALPIARSLGIPLFVTFHGGDVFKDKHYDNRFFKTIYQQRLQELIEYTTKFLCCSKVVQEKLIQRGFPKDKLELHYLGINTHDAKENIKIAKKQRQDILFVGRFVEKKGLDNLIEAMQIVNSKYPDLKLNIVGDGVLKKHYTRMAKQYNINYEFLGWKSQQELMRLGQRALIACVPSKYAVDGDGESFVSTIKEAWLYGAALVTSTHGDAKNIVDDSKGFLFTENDSEELSKAIIAAFNMNASKYAKMQLEGYDTLKQNFDSYTQSNKLQQYFKNHI